VSWLQANEYAKWRSDRVGEKVLQREGYLLKDSNIPGSENVNAESSFNIDTYVISPTQTFGG
jgi:hypothetical protein